MKINEVISESKKGLWANIHAKQNRIKNGSGEHMRKPGSKGAPTDQDFKVAATEAANPGQQAAIAIGKKEEQSVTEGSANVGDIVWAKHHVEQFKTVTGKVLQVDNKFTKIQHKDGSIRSYPNADISINYEELNPNPYRNSTQGVAEGENWSKHNNKRAGGMSDKSVKSYRRSNPGSKIQTAVTTEPSKIKKGSKDAARRKSFCARMKGMKKHNTSAKTARDPDSNINKSLRRWHCESVEQLQELVMLTEQKIRKMKNEL